VNATAHQTAHFPSDLQRIIDAWPTLPEPIRKAMLALADSAK
jgi:hypothetical protein